MSQYKKEFSSVVNEAPWTIWKVFFKIGIPVIVVAIALTLIFSPLSLFKKTFNAEKMIHNYEWFHDVVTQQKARVNQITQFKGFLIDENDKDEKRRLRMEMAAQQMSCRDLVAKYNANSQKMNVSIFKGWSLPDNLEESTCE